MPMLLPGADAPIVKKLARRLRSLLSDRMRDPAQLPTLMGFQEVMAKAMGYPDWHAAQKAMSVSTDVQNRPSPPSNPWAGLPAEAVFGGVIRDAWQENRLGVAIATLAHSVQDDPTHQAMLIKVLEAPVHWSVHTGITRSVCHQVAREGHRESFQWLVDHGIRERAFHQHPTDEQGCSVLGAWVRDLGPRVYEARQKNLKPRALTPEERESQVSLARLLFDPRDPAALVDARAQQKHHTPVLVLAIERGLTHLVGPLLALGEPAGATGSELGYAPLHAALCDHDLTAAQLLLDHGADPNQISGPAWMGGDNGHIQWEFMNDTPLLAALSGDERLCDLEEQERLFSEVIPWALAHGASLEARNDQGKTALHQSWIGGFPHRLKQLIDSGAQAVINARDGHGCTPLMRLIREQTITPASLSVLLRAGADPNLPADDGEFPLMAVIQGAQEWGMVKARGMLADLVAAGADLNQLDAGGMTAADRATHLGRSVMARAMDPAALAAAPSLSSDGDETPRSRRRP